MTHDEKLREILERYAWSTKDEKYALTQAIADINALWGEVGTQPGLECGGETRWLTALLDPDLGETLGDFCANESRPLYARSNPDD